MATGAFPNNPGGRKAILVLQDHEVEKCNYMGATQVLRDEEVYILRWPLIGECEKPTALQHIIDAGLARPGHMLIQSPYDMDIYEEATLAPQRFALEKHMQFTNLCMLLGAKEVVVEGLDERNQSEEETLDVERKRFGVSAQSRVKRDRLTRLREQMTLRDKFDGGVADIDAAEKLLRRTGLWADVKMRNLIEMRRDGKNQLKTRQLQLSLSTETNSTLNVVGRLDLTFLKLSAEYSRVVKEQKDYVLKVTVRF